MKYKSLSLVSVMILMISACLCLQAAEQTVGLIKNDHGAYTGYTLFAPIGSTATYLIDMEGRIVNTWKSNYRPGQSAYLLEDGHLLRTASLGLRASRDFPHGGSGGRVEEFTWDGKLIWEFEYANEDHLLHHDIERMPNGNVLMIAWERKNAEKAMIAGRNPELLREDVLYPDHIIEVKPTYPKGGQIVWQWHVWDHLIQDYDPTMDNFGNIAEHPELLDINFFSVNGPPPGGADLNHINSIDYNPKLDQIVLSVHGTSEIWIIDHSTTTEQAAGHTGGKYGKGGDILYRWGNPQVYRAGTEQDQQFFRQHDAVWIEPQLPDAGNIMVFNNGLGRSKRRFSTVDIIVPPVLKDGSYISKHGVAFGPAKPVWSYAAQNKTDFFSPNISGAQRLPNGNTLICSGANGTFFEVTPDKKLVWKYINPVVNQGPGNGRPGRQSPPMSFDEQGPDRRPLPGGFGARGDRGRRPMDERGNFGPGPRQMPGAGQLRPRQRSNGQRPMNDRGMTAPGMEGPRNEVFRAYRYGPDYPGLKGKDLTPGKLLTELAQKGQIPEPAKQIDRIPRLSNGAKNRTVFVDAANTRGPWDGLSWKTAFRNVQDGINAAAKPAGGEVWIAAGTYKPTTGTDRQISFQLKPGVNVFGGFKGSETKLDQRDYVHNRTILSGDIGRKDYLQDNSYHVVRGSDNAVIDGFIICNGYAVGNLFGQGQQGPGQGGQRQAGMIGPGQRRPGMSGPGQGRPGTNRMEGDNSRAGRAMSSFSQKRPGPAPQRGRGGGIHTTPQAIMQSSQQNSGAGMLNFQATPTIRNCTFQNNHAGKGGAVYNMTSTQFPPRPNQSGPVVIFINCRFYGNTAKGRGGAISNDLGTAPVFLSCIFDSNRCDRKGGAIYNDFGCSPVIINCLFINNTAASAAGVGNDGSSNPVLYYCTFTSNTAEDFGPTLYQGTGPSNNPVLLNSVIWGNYCQWEGVGIYNWHDCQPIVKDSIVEGGYPGKGNSAKAPALDDSGIARQDRGYRGADKRFTEKNLTALLKQLAPYRPARPGGRGVHTRRSEEVKITGSDRIVYVNTQMRSSGNGETWKTAYRNLTDALADVKRDGAQIWLARGTYIPTGQDRSALWRLCRR